MKDLKSYWNKVYDKNEVNQLGWYENNPEPSIKLIDNCKLNKNARILNVGAGASTLIDSLLENGYKNVIATDISVSSLEKLKNRLGKDNSEKLSWIVDDLTKPLHLNEIEPVDLWHDRAVMHFFVNENDQNTYFSLLKKLVKKDGYVIISSFNTDGATMCSGLPVFRYDKYMLQEKLGKQFDLQEFFNHSYTMPSGGTREYIYTLFKRIG